MLLLKYEKKHRNIPKREMEDKKRATLRLICWYRSFAFRQKAKMKSHIQKEFIILLLAKQPLFKWPQKKECIGFFN